jgi:hypothetical protein
MAQFNENIILAAPNPLDKRYLSNRVFGGSQLPYSGISEVYSTIPETVRYSGLTVLIHTGGTNVEFWFKDNVTTLIQKKYESTLPITDYVTGATNLGYFSGKTGIQTLYIDSSGVANDGNYVSQYNYYYIDNGGIIRIGSPTDNGIYRRGYMKNGSPIKSFIYSYFTGGGYQIGWQLIDSDISKSVGKSATSFVLNTYSGLQYKETEWWYNGGIGNTGYYNSGGTLTVQVSGNLYTGTTLTIGARPFAYKQHNDLHFRTMVSDTPSLISVWDDNNDFTHISGVTTLVKGKNVGTGVGVYSGITGSTLIFKKLVGGGNTTVTDTGNQILIYSSGGSGGGTYNLSTPASITVGGISSGTQLTGKTSFQLFEELLVPELFGTITPPSTSIGLSQSGLYEIGCSVSQVVTGTFSRGLINPQYCSVSPYRSGCANAYCFTGAGMPSGYQACSTSPASQTNPSYTVVTGTQTWGVCTQYGAGSPALGSKGTSYCAALIAGNTVGVSNSIVGVYPLYGTTINITTLTKQALVDMLTGNDVQLNLVSESTPNKQKFEIPCAWLSAPRPLVGVCQFNTVSNSWEYPGGSAPASLGLWTTSSSTELVQGNTIGYCRYTYNGVDRSSVCIRLVF